MSCLPRLFPYCLCLLALLGCSGASLVPVEGTVTLDGKPLANATVGLERSGGDKESSLYTADTDAAGKFAIRSFDSGRIGAVPGEYAVMIRSVKAPPGANEMTVLPPERVPPAYRDGSMKLTVPEGGTTTADFAIKTR